jgi:CRISPR-associated endonuclease/helicase Cas3
MGGDFSKAFEVLTGHAPFPWQRVLYERFVSGREDNIPSSCNLPTGLGKTNVIAVWLIALIQHPSKMPRRLVYVVNRRTVVDQTTDEVEKLRKNLPNLENLPERFQQLAISTLRGQFADNREWSADPSRPAVICGTVDMIGSRLLFSGYGVGFKSRPLHAGFLGQDVLLVHDEAHLEPAFQELLTSIEKEQHEGERAEPVPWPKLRVMELSATTRGNDAPFKLTDQDRSDPVVKKRINAKKSLCLHENSDEKKLADDLATLAMQHKESGCAVIVFARKVEDVEKIASKLPRGSAEQLTGTLRGLERDALVKKPVFQRFLPKSSRESNAVPVNGTVYLVCTSAGEVGVNISADHLVCDLSTFESMAQRFGRVNRFGESDNCHIDIVYPTSFDRKEKSDDLDERRRLTLELLRKLDGDASPAALDILPADAKRAAFALTPPTLPATDILFDAWTLTTIFGKLPGRPPVERYLHGVEDEKLAETRVAWRDEVGIITTDDMLAVYPPEGLLEDYPLKPHELLHDRCDRVFKHLAEIANRHPKALAWLVDDQGTVEPLALEVLANKNKRERIEYRTILLPPEVGGLQDGILNGKSDWANDVSDQWFTDDDPPKHRRCRVWDQDAAPTGMRLIRPRIDVQADADESESDEPASHRFWCWFSRPRSADDDQSKTAMIPIKWDHHTKDVTLNTERIVKGLNVPSELRDALTLAAKFHDLGKKREIWQRSIGNLNPTDWYAKSGKGWRPRDICPGYRHEFGSLLDVEKETEIQQLTPEMKDLVLHLIAAHHGYARPHFPPDNAYDPEPNGQDVTAFAIEVPRRFARLQRKYGRWGLAYLESLLRAADWAASAAPSEVAL